MRCERHGTLYPITFALEPSASSFAALAPSLWHNRLGHPVLQSLRQNKLIECNKLGHSNVCYSFPLGKNVKLPFVASKSTTLMPFDIIHCDLWTSPVISSVGHRHYLVIVDDYSNYVWTFPLSKKS